MRVKNFVVEGYPKNMWVSQGHPKNLNIQTLILRARENPARPHTRVSVRFFLSTVIPLPATQKHTQTQNGC